MLSEMPPVLGPIDSHLDLFDSESDDANASDLGSFSHAESDELFEVHAAS